MDKWDRQGEYLFHFFFYFLSKLDARPSRNSKFYQMFFLILTQVELGLTEMNAERLYTLFKKSKKETTDLKHTDNDKCI